MALAHDNGAQMNDNTFGATQEYCMSRFASQYTINGDVIYGNGCHVGVEIPAQKASGN